MPSVQELIRIAKSPVESSYSKAKFEEIVSQLSTTAVAETVQLEAISDAIDHTVHANQHKNSFDGTVTSYASDMFGRSQEEFLKEQAQNIREYGDCGFNENA